MKTLKPGEYNPVGNPYTWEEIEAEGLDDFRVFLCLVWAYLDLPEPTPAQLDMAYNLQHGPRRFIIQAFRGVGKSWITVAFALWLLFLNPQLKIEVISASGKLAEDWVKFARQIIRGMDLLKHLEPRRGQRSKATIFDVGPARDSKDPSLKAAGIDGQITGTRADVIIADDIEIPKNSFTLHLREKLSEQVKEFDAILKPGGRVIYLGTPQVEETVYRKLGTRGYRVRVWTSEIPEDPEVYKGNLAPFVMKMIEAGAIPGTPVDPKRFDEQDLAERRLSYGKSGYALQFLLDTSLSDADKHPLKLENLLVMDLDGELGHVKLAWGRDRDLAVRNLMAGGFDGDGYYGPAWKSDQMAPFTGTVMAIDPSGRGKDETSYAIVRYLHGNLFLVASGGFSAGFSEETLSALAAVAARHGVNYVIAEDNYGGGMFRQLLKPHLAKYNKGSCPECEDGEECPHGKAGTFDDEWNAWSRGQKELRILDTLEPILGSHKLVVDRRVLEKDLKTQEDTPWYSLVQQMTRLAREKDCLRHDDRVEALAMACSYWVEKMNRDTDRELDRHKAKLLKESLKTFKQHVFNVAGKARRKDVRKRRPKRR